MSDYKFMIIDSENMTQISVELMNDKTEIIKIPYAFENITKYIEKKTISKDKNMFNRQLLPLIAEGVITTITELYDKDTSNILLSEEAIREALKYSMMVGFYLNSWMLQNNIKIYTTEKPISQEEINKYHRFNQAIDFIMNCNLDNLSDKNVIVNKIVEMNYITKDEIEEFLSLITYKTDEN